MNVDWRNRGGRNFITSVRSQGGAPNCWAFAMTALYESMIRIEHNLWTRRSEGDAARGAGKQAWDWGNAGEAHIFVERYGLADPDCFPWSEAAALYTAKPHGPALSALPLSPTSDRAGRTMKIRPGTLVSLSTDKQKKDWIDLVGPMVVQVPVRWDFNALGTQIYVPSPASGIRGEHLMLVVGFNDDDQCWIVKNSWATTWGDRGFGRIAYAANMLEPREFVGVRGTNPDPWAKRRQRTGSLVQSGNGGSNNNFELFALVGANLFHWYRDNANWQMLWNGVGPIASVDPWRPLLRNAIDERLPVVAVDGPAVVQSSFNRNYELLYRCSDRRLHHSYFDQASGWWFDAAVVGEGGVDFIDGIGIPGFIQSDRGAPGDFEVVVVGRTGEAEHWTKHNSAPWTRLPGQWYRREMFGSAFGFSGPSLVQSRLGVTGSPENGRGELHYVGATSAGELQHWRKAASGSWQFLSRFGVGVTSGPALIEGTYGAGDESGVGNFELCVAVGQRVQHWWRHNRSLGAWIMGAEFGDAVARVVGLLQGTNGTNLEMIVQRTDQRYQHYWRDGAGWHPGSLV